MTLLWNSIHQFYDSIVGDFKSFMDALKRLYLYLNDSSSFFVENLFQRLIEAWGFILNLLFYGFIKENEKPLKLGFIFLANSVWQHEHNKFREPKLSLTVFNLCFYYTII